MVSSVRMKVELVARIPARFIDAIVGGAVEEQTQ
jgi:hypothetical protein